MLSIELRSSAGAIYSPNHLGMSLAFEDHFKETALPQKRHGRQSMLSTTENLAASHTVDSAVPPLLPTWKTCQECVYGPEDGLKR